MWDHLPKVIFLQNRGRQLLRIKSLKNELFSWLQKRWKLAAKKRGWRQKKETREMHFHGEASQPGWLGQTDRLYNLEDCCQNLYISKFANCRKILSVSGCTQYFPPSGKIHEKEGINISGCVVLRGPLPAISGPWLAFVTAEEVTSCPPPGWSGPLCLFQRTSLTSRTWHWHKSWQGQWPWWQNTSAYCSLELPWQETCSVYKRTIKAKTRRTIGVTEGNILSHCWISDHKWWWLVAWY